MCITNSGRNTDLKLSFECVCVSSCWTSPWLSSYPVSRHSCLFIGRISHTRVTCVLFFSVFFFFNPNHHLHLHLVSVSLPVLWIWYFISKNKFGEIWALMYIQLRGQKCVVPVLPDAQIPKFAFALGHREVSRDSRVRAGDWLNRCFLSTNILFISSWTHFFGSDIKTLAEDRRSWCLLSLT